MTIKTCVSIAEDSPEKIERTMTRALVRSEFVEIRFDFLDPVKIPEALQMTEKNLGRAICTLRPKSEGGKFSGSEEERVSILKQIAEYKPFLLDVEYETLRKDKALAKHLKKTNTDVLVSWHDFEGTPNAINLIRRFEKMCKFSNNIKIVTTAETKEDGGRLLGLYSIADGINLIAFSMGNIGSATRIISTDLGCPFVYVYLDKPVAPGQPSLEEVKDIWFIINGKQSDRESE